jgi:hypothetical protein
MLPVVTIGSQRIFHSSQQGSTCWSLRIKGVPPKPSVSGGTSFWQSKQIWVANRRVFIAVEAHVAGGRKATQIWTVVQAPHRSESPSPSGNHLALAFPGYPTVRLASTGKQDSVLHSSAGLKAVFDLSLLRTKIIPMLRNIFLDTMLHQCYVSGDGILRSSLSADFGWATSGPK